MTNPIYHHTNVPMLVHGEKTGSASVALFVNGAVIVSLSADLGAMSINFHTDADSLRAFAKLLADAVDALPAKVENAA